MEWIERPRVILTFCTCLLAMFAAPVGSQEINRPTFLVATPALHDIYGRSVILVVPVSHGEHIGFIINRVSRRTLASAFPRLAAAKKATDPIYVGGPEALGTIFAFVRAKNRPADAIPLFDDLFLAASPEAVIRIVERAPTKARFVSGYMSWSANELRDEIERGIWHISRPRAEMLFRKDVDSVWPELIEQVLLRDASVRAYRHRPRSPLATGAFDKSPPSILE